MGREWKEEIFLAACEKEATKREIKHLGGLREDKIVMMKKSISF